ncbi:MAG: histidine kinase [Actinobacteria bacterium]|nr:histidine kinase [Actinomycetota bacterium]
MRTPIAARLAAVLLGLEAVAIAGLVMWQFVALAAGDIDSPTSAVALAVMTALGAAAVAAFAVATWRGVSWGRSGGIVTQALILAVALGAATGAYAHPVTGILLAIPAVVALVLLFAAVKRAGADRRAAPAEHGDVDGPPA